MKHHQILKYISLFATTISLTMCDSNIPSSQASKQCRIVSTTITNSKYNTVISHQYTYNDDGLISEMIHDNGSTIVNKFITYRSGKPYLVQVFPEQSNEWASQYEVTLYANGNLKDITALNNYPGAKPTSSSFTKFSLTNTAIVGTQTEIHASLFSWDINNDMIRFVDEDYSDDDSKGTYYTYYTDKEYSPKNIDAFTRSLSTYQGFDYIIFFGAPAYDTPHLVKEQRDEYNTSSYEYEFDADEKITKITITSDTGVKSFVTPVYDCQ